MAKNQTSFKKVYNFIDDLDKKITEISQSEVARLAGLGFTVQEIADSFGCSKDTIERNCQAALLKGRSECTGSIKRELFKQMKGGSTTAGIWLSKQYCGFSDQVNVDYTKLDLNKLKEDAHIILKELENEATH